MLRFHFGTQNENTVGRSSNHRISARRPLLASRRFQLTELTRSPRAPPLNLREFLAALGNGAK
jgi:hypothetical protein